MRAVIRVKAPPSGEARDAVERDQAGAVAREQYPVVVPEGGEPLGGHVRRGGIAELGEEGGDRLGVARARLAHRHGAGVVIRR